MVSISNRRQDIYIRGKKKIGQKYKQDTHMTKSTSTSDDGTTNSDSHVTNENNRYIPPNIFIL